MIAFTTVATAALVIAIGMLASAPGVLLVRDAEGKPGIVVAAATISLVAMMVLTGLIGQLAGLVGLSIPATAIVAVSLTATAAAWLLPRTKPQFGQLWMAVEWQGWTLAAVLVVGGLVSLAIGFEDTADGVLMIHSWYNADWFKHMGHVHGLANYGLPARDSFGAGNPLYYYWISYIWSGAAASITGDGWAALAAANALTTVYFSLVFYAMIRMAGIRPNFAMVLGLLAILVCAPAGFAIFLLQGYTLEGFLSADYSPNGPALLALAQVIPQHTLALTTLLAYLVLAQPAREAERTLILLASFALAAVMTVSTLLGMMLLISYGLLRLYRGRIEAVPELAAMAVGSAVLVFALGVLQFDNPDSAVESPLLQNGEATRAAWDLAIASALKVISLVGFPALVAAFAMWKWRPTDPVQRYLWQIVIVLFLGALIGSMGTQVLLSSRLAAETFIRAALPMAVGAAIACAWGFHAAWNAGKGPRAAALTATLLLAALAIPSFVVRMAWIGNFGDEYTTFVPADDRAAMVRLRASSEARSMVWQYPEKPLVGQPSGGDAWAVVFAGRTVANSERATDYPLAQPYIELSERYFAGEPVQVPRQANWVYLSRTLHPETYELLRDRLRTDVKWREEICYADACLFERRRAENR